MSCTNFSGPRSSRRLCIATYALHVRSDPEGSVIRQLGVVPIRAWNVSSSSDRSFGVSETTIYDAMLGRLTAPRRSSTNLTRTGKEPFRLESSQSGYFRPLRDEHRSHLSCQSLWNTFSRPNFFSLELADPPCSNLSVDR